MTETTGIPAVLLFETRSRWAPELKRQFVSETVRVRSCGSWSDLYDRLAESPDSLLVLDLSVGAAETLRFLGHQVGETSIRPIIVIAEQRATELEWSLRELGTIQFFTDDLSGEDLADFCRRQWRMMGIQTDDREHQ